MDSLRWILLILGLALVAVVYVWGRPRKPDIFANTDLEDRVDPVLDVTSGETDAEERQQGSELPPEHDKIVSLIIKARFNGVLHGSDICVAADKAGLRYGKKKIFERLHERDDRELVIFSMANAIEPGIFDLDEIYQVQTPALVLFMTLPGVMSALDTWDAMLASAQRLAELLDAELLDQDQSTLGRQTIAHIRDEMRQYDREHNPG